MTKPEPELNSLDPTSRLGGFVVWKAIAVAVLALGVLLGIRLYIEPRLYWSDLWPLLIAAAFQWTVVWLVFSAPWSARVAGLGFVAGVIVEFAAMQYVVSNNLITWTWGTWTPEGWYPLSLPIERLLIHQGWSTNSKAPLVAQFSAMALSGAMGSMVAFGMWWLLSRLQRQQACSNIDVR